MKTMVTGSAGHLGEALVRTLVERDGDVVSIDRKPSPFTTHVGDLADRAFVAAAVAGVEVVYHAATLHKPHVATHVRQHFIDGNISGTLNLLEEASAAGVHAFVFTSTTSVFGDALVPPPGHPAAWITEDVVPVPKNIYGVSKTAAEDLCRLFWRNQKLPCVVLRTSRFFPEDDDNHAVRSARSSDNTKANEYLYRRVDIEDVVSAHLLAAQHAPALGFERLIISATTPFELADLAALRTDAAAVLARRVPEYRDVYARLGWQMDPGIDRVYVNARARALLGWTPRHDFRAVLSRLASRQPLASPLAQMVGSKGYHETAFAEGPYPVAPH